ncbi:MAG: hypothetical protein AB8B89_09810 [Gammaproteobacteria bacterium]
MKRPSFFEGAFIGIIASIFGSTIFTTFSWFISSANVMQFVITLISFAYLIYLLSRSQEKLGRIIVLACWCVVTGAAWLISLPLIMFILTQISMLWLIRSLYFYSSIVPALIDLSMTAISFSVAVATVFHTSSIFLGFWCFFLIQALFVFIPVRISKNPTSQSLTNTTTDNFNKAHRSAEAALRKISSIS